MEMVMDVRSVVKPWGSTGNDPMEGNVFRPILDLCGWQNSVFQADMARYDGLTRGDGGDRPGWIDALGFNRRFFFSLSFLRSTRWVHEPQNLVHCQERIHQSFHIKKNPLFRWSGVGNRKL